MRRFLLSRRPRRADRRRERGVVSIELAFVVPMLVMLVMGSLEIGHQWRAATDLSEATRSAVRTSTHLNGEPTLAAEADREAMRAMEAMLDERWDDVVEIRIFDGEFQSCAAAGAACNVYDGTENLDDDSLWGCAGLAYDRQWCPTGRDSSAPDTGAVAVEIEARVPYITNIIGSGATTITRRTVMRIEPET